VRVPPDMHSQELRWPLSWIIRQLLRNYIYQSKRLHNWEIRIKPPFWGPSSRNTKNESNKEVFFRLHGICASIFPQPRYDSIFCGKIPIHSTEEKTTVLSGKSLSLTALQKRPEAKLSAQNEWFPPFLRSKFCGQEQDLTIKAENQHEESAQTSGNLFFAKKYAKNQGTPSASHQKNKSVKKVCKKQSMQKKDVNK